MANKTADAAKLVVRLPKSLHRRLKQQAKRNNVSLNTEIVNQLEGAEGALLERVVEMVANIRWPVFVPGIEKMDATQIRVLRSLRAIYERDIREMEEIERKARERLTEQSNTQEPEKK
jgi:HicB family